jgi:hypothetical protein
MPISMRIRSAIRFPRPHGWRCTTTIITIIDFSSGSAPDEPKAGLRAGFLCFDSMKTNILAADSGPMCAKVKHL